jgi:carbonic anhydrase
MGIANLLEQNRVWSERMRASDERFFDRLAEQQAPRYLWIGCSDSRVPANQITGLGPGEMFVHRNVANLVVHTDLNCLAVMQYAIDVLRVTDIIVCGHYECGGVLAALRNDRLGLIDNWLRHVQDVAAKHAAELAPLDSEAERHRRLCELNVVEQVVNVCQTSFVSEAWANGRTLAVHGWIYKVTDGLLRDLGLCVTRPDEVRQWVADSKFPVPDSSLR